MAHAHYAGIPKKLHLRFALLWGDKPPVVATDAKPRVEISSLNLCRGAKEENCKLTDAPLTSAPTGVDLRFASAASYGVPHEAE